MNIHRATLADIDQLAELFDGYRVFMSSQVILL